jgi:hypothetical protein
MKDWSRSELLHVVILKHIIRRLKIMIGDPHDAKSRKSVGQALSEKAYWVKLYVHTSQVIIRNADLKAHYEHHLEEEARK